MRQYGVNTLIVHVHVRTYIHVIIISQHMHVRPRASADGSDELDEVVATVDSIKQKGLAPI